MSRSDKLSVMSFHWSFVSYERPVHDNELKQGEGSVCDLFPKQ